MNGNEGTLRHQDPLQEAWTRGWAEHGRVGEEPEGPAQMLPAWEQVARIKRSPSPALGDEHN